MKRYYYSFDTLRFVLAFFVCVMTFGVPVSFGGFIQVLSGFAAIAFYIIAGYLTVGASEHMQHVMHRAMRRAAILFAILAGAYALLNVPLYLARGEHLFFELGSVRAWFEFAFFNTWPLRIGKTIWYVQCLLYGYVAIYLLNKLRLLRYDWIIILICMTAAILTGELAGLIGFKVFGFTCIPATVLTRSLPYLLIGRRIRIEIEAYWTVKDPKKKEKKKKKENEGIEETESIPKVVWIAFLLLGTVMTILELGFLIVKGKVVYTGHFIGNGVIAIAACIMAAVKPTIGKKGVRRYGRLTALVVYVLHHPLGYYLRLLIERSTSDWTEVINIFLAPIVFLLCAAIALPIYRIKQKNRHIESKWRVKR